MIQLRVRTLLLLVLIVGLGLWQHKSSQFWSDLAAQSNAADKSYTRYHVAPPIQEPPSKEGCYMD